MLVREHNLDAATGNRLSVVSAITASSYDLCSGSGSSVGIATDYGLDGPG